jgi:hypothetical protein
MKKTRSKKSRDTVPLRGYWILDPLTSLNLVPKWHMKAGEESVILPFRKKVSSYYSTGIVY